MLSEFLFSQEKERNRRSSNSFPVDRIQVNYSVVKNIDLLAKSYHKIQELSLNHNLLVSLAGIEQFSNLRIFHIKFNFICDLSEFLRIPNKNLLVSLNFIGNPAESQLAESPNFLNNFINLRNFNSGKECNLNFGVDSAGMMGSAQITRKSQFIDDSNRGKDLASTGVEIEEALLTGNFNTKKCSFDLEDFPFRNNRMHNEDFFQNSEEDRNYENKRGPEEVSFSSQREEVEEDPVEAHISHIDEDISRLSVIFYEKMLKEKAILGLKRYFLHKYYQRSKFSKEFNEKRLKNRTFWTWRKMFIEKLLLKQFSRNLTAISGGISEKTPNLVKALSISTLTLRGKKQNNLRRITETDQDFIDSNREQGGEGKIEECKVLRENNVITNEQIREKTLKNLGFDEYKKISLRNARNEKVTEENYRHDLPLSTSFTSKCPYGSL